MTITIFVPDWDANDDMRAKADARKGFELYQDQLVASSGHSFPLSFSAEYGCDIIRFNSRLDVPPKGLADIPLKAVVLIKHNSPVTRAPDGVFTDMGIYARVETYIKDGVRQQTFSVTLNTETSETLATKLFYLNVWFDALAAGEKNGRNSAPITYPEPPPAPEVAAPQ